MSSPLVFLPFLLISGFLNQIILFFLSPILYKFSLLILILMTFSFFFVSNYLVLGKTSPLTYQVLGECLIFKIEIILQFLSLSLPEIYHYLLFYIGHLKTVCVLILGFYIFENKADIRNIFGILIAFVGVVSYTEVLFTYISQSYYFLY